VYGKFEDHKGDQASPYSKFRKQAETGTIKLFEGSSNFRRDFVPVETVIDVHKKFFDITESGVWNVGTGVAKSFEDVAQQIASETGAKIEEIPMPEHLRGGYQTYTRADLTKLYETISTL
jgi:ADP-L-glycero-D-manno-heptose 6-epimerase